jgi:type II secretory pathway pseudopilin PulG
MQKGGSMSHPYKASGFSLIELLIIMTLLAIVAGVAIPNFQRLVQANRAQGATEELLAQLQFARSEAVVRNRIVTVENLSGTDGRWDQQIRIYVSGNQTPNRAFVPPSSPPAAGDDVELRFHEGMNNVTLTAIGDARVEEWISFRPNGTLAITGASSIIVCPDNQPDRGRSLTLEPSGRIAMPATAPTVCTP